MQQHEREAIEHAVLVLEERRRDWNFKDRTRMKKDDLELHLRIDAKDESAIEVFSSMIDEVDRWERREDKIHDDADHGAEIFDHFNPIG